MISRFWPSFIWTAQLKLDEMVTNKITLNDVNEAFEAMHHGDVLRSVIVFKSRRKICSKKDTDMTTTTMPELMSNYPLSPEQTASYQKMGHIFLPGVASREEIAAYRGLSLILLSVELLIFCRWSSEALTGKRFCRWKTSGAKKRSSGNFTLSRRFGKIAADLMGVDGVRLYHDQALFKEPGGGPTPWHQDQGYWPLDTQQTITMWMPLVDVSAQSGTMTFASGSQATGYLGDLPISDKSEAEFDKFVAGRATPCIQMGR